MVSPEDFRKALGTLADGMTDEQIRDANERMSRLAGALFGMWGETLVPHQEMVDHSDTFAVE